MESQRQTNPELQVVLSAVSADAGPTLTWIARQYIIYGLGRKLLVLDDEPISDDERLNAIEFVQKEEQSKKSSYVTSCARKVLVTNVGYVSRVHKGGWVATREKAIVQHHKLTAKDARKQTSSGNEWRDRRRESVLTGTF